MTSRYICAYNTLDNYNSAQSSSQMRDSGIHPPVPAGTPSMKVQVVPQYGMIGYEALTHDGRCDCGGHFTITNAYPAYGNNCTKFTQRLCSD